MGKNSRLESQSANSDADNFQFYVIYIGIFEYCLISMALVLILMLISVPTAVSRRPLLRARGKEVLPGGLWAAFRSHLLRVWTVHYRWEKNGGIAANMETKCDCREKWWSPHCFTYWFWSYLFLVHLSVSCITLDPSRKMCAFIDPTDYKFNSAGCIGSKLLFYPLKISIRGCPMISLYLRGWLRLQNSYNV